MIQKINHIQVSIPENSEVPAREFYRDFLGLKEISKPESLQGRGGFWLGCGDLQIHFGTEDGIDRKASKAYVAYQVTDLLHWKTKLTSRGIECKDGVPIPGMNRFDFRDPFGNRIEFLEIKQD